MKSGFPPLRAMKIPLPSSSTFQVPVLVVKYKLAGVLVTIPQPTQTKTVLVPHRSCRIVPRVFQPLRLVSRSSPPVWPFPVLPTWLIELCMLDLDVLDLPSLERLPLKEFAFPIHKLECLSSPLAVHLQIRSTSPLALAPVAAQAAPLPLFLLVAPHFKQPLPIWLCGVLMQMETSSPIPPLELLGLLPLEPPV